MTGPKIMSLFFMFVVLVLQIIAVIVVAALIGFGAYSGYRAALKIFGSR